MRTGFWGRRDVGELPSVWTATAPAGIWYTTREYTIYIDAYLILNARKGDTRASQEPPPWSFPWPVGLLLFFLEGDPRRPPGDGEPPRPLSERCRSTKPRVEPKS